MDDCVEICCAGCCAACCSLCVTSLESWCGMKTIGANCDCGCCSSCNSCCFCCGSSKDSQIDLKERPPGQEQTTQPVSSPPMQAPGAPTGGGEVSASTGPAEQPAGAPVSRTTHIAANGTG